MKILVADKIAQKGVDLLKAQPGCEVVVAHNTPVERLPALVADVDAILVRSETRITAEVLAAAPKLRAVGRAGVGVDNIDVEAATARGVVVMNTPTGNTIATAELTFTHLLCGARPVTQAAASMRSGAWDRKSFTGTELHQKVLGIAGLGRIGTEVARRAQAFGMRVLVYDPYLSPSRARALQVETVDLDGLCTQADFITVHLPLTDQTRHLLGAPQFARMKRGVRLFNVARGGIIDEAALLAALRSGQVAGAGLDVFEEEPLPADHPFRSLPQVVLTPHLGASTQEAQESVGIEIAELVLACLRDGIIRNAVNVPSVDAATLRILGPFLELGWRLGTLVQQTAPPQLERLRLTYRGRVVDLDVDGLTRSILRGFLRHIAGDEVNFVNAPLVIQRLGLRTEVIKSNAECDYTELIEVEAIGADGRTYSAAGTLLGRNNAPRLVALHGREVEASPIGTLLLVENRDEPGMVGVLGTILGRHGVNIATMSLSREQAGATALAVFNLDTAPAEAALAEIRARPGIVRAEVVRF